MKTGQNKTPQIDTILNDGSQISDAELAKQFPFGKAYNIKIDWHDEGSDFIRDGNEVFPVIGPPVPANLLR